MTVSDLQHFLAESEVVGEQMEAHDNTNIIMIATKEGGRWYNSTVTIVIIKVVRKCNRIE